jgi:uncharacterized protein (DUF427 family)
MAMTVGSGPFGHTPNGVWNRETPETKGLIYFEDFPRRMRAEFAGETIVDSRHAKLLHEHGLLPTLYFPAEEVRTDLFRPSEKHTKCPWKGQASYWSLDVAGIVAKDAVWEYKDPIPESPPVKGYFGIYWDKMDRWLEEDEETIGHVRDPYHRVDILGSSRHVKVSLDGVVLAETKRPKALYETSLPVRWYIPPEDVRLDLLQRSDKPQSICAYKGYADYLSVQVNGEVKKDLVWTYAEPRRDAERIRGHLCFYNEFVDIEVDGEPQGRPESPFSKR